MCSGHYLTGFMESCLEEDDADDQNGDDENENDDYEEKKNKRKDINEGSFVRLKNSK